jgi:hypothetical protein
MRVKPKDGGFYYPRTKDLFSKTATRRGTGSAVGSARNGRDYIRRRARGHGTQRGLTGGL